jgi:hypothetical protein
MSIENEFYGKGLPGMLKTVTKETERPETKHVEYGNSVAMSSKVDDAKWFKALAQSTNCLWHKFCYFLDNKHYKLYRRGKNRCKRCGVRVK